MASSQRAAVGHERLDAVCVSRSPGASSRQGRCTACRRSASGQRQMLDHRWRTQGASCRPTTATRATAYAYTSPPPAEAFDLVKFDEDAEDYYSIIGVAPNANQKTIKQAYYATMRDSHPDLTEEEEATVFCTFLNEIYETLSDPDTRAAYDALIGFSDTAVNPFKDTGFEYDQAFVDEFTCIGCKACANVCPKTFQIMDEEAGRARVIRQDGEPPEAVQEAIDTCPVDCISWVTAPQLTLLETTMRKMERVAAWILMTGGGSAVNVFQEASIAWEKRQAGIRARTHKEQSGWGLGWAASGAAAAGLHSDNGKGQQQPASARLRSRLQTATAAAAAARRWRDYQRQKRKKEELSLPAGR